MRIVALVADLMDRSKVSATVPDAVFVQNADACSGADVVVIDLDRFADAVAGVRSVAPHARIVGFGPHVDTAVLAAAERDGADTVLARSAFFRDVGAVLAADSGTAAQEPPASET